MKVGDKIEIGGQKFNVLFMYEDYMLVCLDDADEERMAAGTLVFRKDENNKLILIKDKEQIKMVITKLFEAAQGNN